MVKAMDAEISPQCTRKYGLVWCEEHLLPLWSQNCEENEVSAISKLSAQQTWNLEKILGAGDCLQRKGKVSSEYIKYDILS